MLTLETRVVQSEEILSADLDQEVVLLDAAKGMYYGVDGVGKRIMGYLADPIAIQQICERIQQHYGVPPEVCHRDTLAFLEQLHAKGIVEIVA